MNKYIKLQIVITSMFFIFTIINLVNNDNNAVFLLWIPIYYIFGIALFNLGVFLGKLMMLENFNKFSKEKKE